MVERAPVIAMVVNNGMANDARVLKSAVSLARAGAAVHVLGVSSAGHPRSECRAGGVSYTRLPALPGRGVSPAYLRYAVERRLGRLAAPINWRRTLPVTRLYREAFTPALTAIDPDLVHIHDVHLLESVTRALPEVPVIYDAHEYVAGLAVSGARTQRAVDAWAALEREVIPGVDRVLTVSAPIAARLENEHSLRAPVTVVLNAPIASTGALQGPSLRSVAGVGASTPLAVYSGAVSAARGLATVIQALPLVPNLHLAVVAVPYPHPMAPELRALAERLGVADRVHLVPPVSSAEVPAYLSSADIGVSAILGDSVSYDLALPNKLFEFLHAGLTVVTSDLAGMSAFVREHRLGEVFTQGDPADCAEALRRAMAAAATSDRADLITQYSWQAVEPVLVRVHADLLAAGRRRTKALRASTEPWNVDDLALRFP